MLRLGWDSWRNGPVLLHVLREELIQAKDRGARGSGLGWVRQGRPFASPRARAPLVLCRPQGAASWSNTRSGGRGLRLGLRTGSQLLSPSLPGLGPALGG